MKAIDGTDIAFDRFKGIHCLVVNVASQCGYTPQYEGLEKLQKDFAAKKFTVLGFPCNQFGAQEPGSNAQICDFAESNFGVTFPMFGKVDVRDEGACELYQWLTAQKARPNGKSNIGWNFTKFLVDGEGQVLERFEPQVTPTEIASKLNEIL